MRFVFYRYMHGHTRSLHGEGRRELFNAVMECNAITETHTGSKPLQAYRCNSWWHCHACKRLHMLFFYRFILYTKWDGHQLEPFCDKNIKKQKSIERRKKEKLTFMHTLTINPLPLPQAAQRMYKGVLQNQSLFGFILMKGIKWK